MDHSAFDPMSLGSQSASHALAAAIGLPIAPSAVARGKQPMVGDAHPTTYPVYDPESPFTAQPAPVARPDGRLKARLRGVGADFLVSPELRRAGGSMSSLNAVYDQAGAAGDDGWSAIAPPPAALSLTYQHANASSFTGGPNRRRTASSTGYAPYAGGDRKRSASGVASPPPSAGRNRNPKSLRVVTMPAPPKLVHTLSTDSNGSMPLTPVSNTTGSLSPMFDDWANLPSLSEPKVPWQSPASARTLSNDGLGVTFTAAPTFEPSMPFSFADLYNIGLGQADEDAFCAAATGDLMPSPMLEADGLIGVDRRTETIDPVSELTFAHGLPTPLLTAHSTMSSPASSAASQCVSPSALNPALISPHPSQSPPSHHPPPALYDPLTQMNGLAFLTDASWDPPIVPLVRRQLGGGVVRGLSGQHATGSFANVGSSFLDELDDGDTTVTAAALVSPPISPPALRERSARPRKRARSETIDEQDEDAEGERDDGASSAYAFSDEPSDDEYRPDFGSPPQHGRRGGGGHGAAGDFYFDANAHDFIVDTSHGQKRQRTVSGQVIRRLRPGPKPRTERGQARADAAAASLPPPTSPQQAFVTALSSIGAPLDDRVAEEVAVASELEAYGGPTVSLSKDAIRSLYADLPHDHKSKNRFACLIEGCGRTFPRKSAIESHIQTHLEDKPFLCAHPGWSVGHSFEDADERSGARFVRQHDQRRHERIHSNVKPHQCPWCVGCSA